MRKILALLLVLLLCAVGAAAEGLLTEGEFVYYIWNDTQWGNGEVAVIVDYRLEEGQSEVFIPLELGGYPVLIVETDNLPASVQTVCAPEHIGGVYAPEGRELVEFLYVGEANQSEYTLTDVHRIKTVNGESTMDEMLLTLEMLPQKIGGQKVNADLLRPPVVEETVEETVYTYGELLYTRDEARQTATIVGYELAEGQTELFIPTAIEGYTVANFEYENVPLQIEKLWVNANTGKTIWNFGDKPTNHERLAYHYTQTTEDSITLESVALESWDGEGNMVSKERFVAADAVPETIAGNSVSFDAKAQGAIEEGTFVTADGWKYRAFVHYDGRKTAEIMDCPMQDWGDTMVIPMSINGFTPSLIALEAIPESVHTVIIPGDGSSGQIINNTPSNRFLRRITYTDWEGAGQSEALDRPAEMQQDDLMWTRVVALDFATGESLDCMPYNIVSEEELPAEINGQRVINPEGAITVSRTSGDWEYMLDDYLGTNIEAYILAYNGEGEPGYLVVPEKLDGNKIRAIHIDAIPESAKAIYVKGYNTSVFADNSTCERELLMVTYRESNKNVVTLENIWKLAVEEGKVDESRGYLSIKEVPREINGKSVQVPNSRYFTYSSGEWEYYLHKEGQPVAWITQSQMPEGVTEMTVPKELDGYTVRYVDMAAIPQSVQTINIPKGCHVRTEQENRPNLKIVEAKK